MKGMVIQMIQKCMKETSIFRGCYNYLCLLTIIYPIIQEQKNEFNVDLIIDELKATEYVDEFDKEFYINYLLSLKNKDYTTVLSEVGRDIDMYIENYLADEYDRQRDDM